jgi:hypothetical protein
VCIVALYHNLAVKMYKLPSKVCIVAWWTVMFKLIKNLNLNLFILIANSSLKQIWFGFLILTLVWIQCIVVWKLRYVFLRRSLYFVHCKAKWNSSSSTLTSLTKRRKEIKIKQYMKQF